MRLRSSVRSEQTKHRSRADRVRGTDVRIALGEAAGEIWKEDNARDHGRTQDSQGDREWRIGQRRDQADQVDDPVDRGNADQDQAQLDAVEKVVVPAQVNHLVRDECLDLVSRQAFVVDCVDEHSPAPWTVEETGAQPAVGRLRQVRDSQLCRRAHRLELGVADADAGEEKDLLVQLREDHVAGDEKEERQVEDPVIWRACLHTERAPAHPADGDDRQRQASQRDEQGDDGEAIRK